MDVANEIIGNTFLQEASLKTARCATYCSHATATPCCRRCVRPLACSLSHSTSSHWSSRCGGSRYRNAVRLRPTAPQRMSRGSQSDASSPDQQWPSIDPALSCAVQQDAYLGLARDAAVEQIRFYRTCALWAIVADALCRVAPRVALAAPQQDDVNCS